MEQSGEDKIHSNGGKSAFFTGWLKGIAALIMCSVLKFASIFYSAGQ